MQTLRVCLVSENIYSFNHKTITLFINLFRIYEGLQWKQLKHEKVILIVSCTNL